MSDSKIENIEILLSEQSEIITTLDQQCLQKIFTLSNKYKIEKETLQKKKITPEKIKLCIEHLNKNPYITSTELLNLSGAKNLSVLTFQINNYLKIDNLYRLIKKKRSGQTVYCLEISSSIE